MADAIEHTAGPWVYAGQIMKVNGDDLFVGAVDPVLDPGRFRGQVCSIQSCDHIEEGISRDEAEANAQLIAAAPDMLAALERIYALYPRGDLNHVDYRVEAAHIAEDAIAKAARSTPDTEGGAS